jgi:hypothetical protein
MKMMRIQKGGVFLFNGQRMRKRNFRKKMCKGSNGILRGRRPKWVMGRIAVPVPVDNILLSGFHFTQSTTNFIMSDDSDDSSAGGEDSSSKSSDDVFMNAHYFEMEDMGYWIDRNKEIRTRWQEEKEFTMQLKEDVALRDTFRVVIGKRERTDEEDVWFSSGMKTINRAFKNRFNMICEVVRETKIATALSEKDLRLDEVAKELEHVMIMMGQFQEEEGDFKFFYDQTRRILQEFVKWKTNEAKETPAQVGTNSK